MPPLSDPEQIQAALAAPFEMQFIKLKPGVVSKDGKTALAMVHVDARGVAERLDRVVGVQNWQDDYSLLAGGFVECRLSLRINGEWITKVDVGVPGQSPKDGDKIKGAYSDALKRASYKFGVGRYLYTLTNVWINYDSQYKRFDRAAVENYKRTICPDGKPRVQARSAAQAAAAPARPQEAPQPALARPTVDPVTAERGDAYEPPEQPQVPPEKQTAVAPLPAEEKKAPPPRPTNGRDLEVKLYQLDRKLHSENRIRSDELMTAVLLHVRRQFPATEGEPPPHIYEWGADRINCACDKANDFISKLPKKEERS